VKPEICEKKERKKTRKREKSVTPQLRAREWRWIGKFCGGGDRFGEEGGEEG